MNITKMSTPSLCEITNGMQVVFFFVFFFHVVWVFHTIKILQLLSKILRLIFPENLRASNLPSRKNKASIQINHAPRYRILISVAKCSGLSKEAGKHRTLWFPIHDVGQIAAQADQSGGAGPTSDSAPHGERRSPAQSQLTVRRRASPTSTAKHTQSRLVLTIKFSWRDRSHQAVVMRKLHR